MHPRRAVGPAGLVALALALVLVLTGCGATTTGTPEPATTPEPGAARSTEPEPPADPRTAAEVREAGTRLDVGDLRLAVGPDVTALSVRSGSEAGPDGSFSYRFTSTPDESLDASRGPVTLARLAAPEGSTFEVHPDLSVVLLDASGDPVAGVAPPTVGGSASASWRPRLEPVGRDLLLLELEPASTATGSEVETTWWVTGTALLGATWGEREGGRSVAVEPTAWARAGHTAAVALTWAQLVDAEPEADAGSMHDQLVCHTIGAPDKATWNLEPWRPDVGLLSVLAAACNPT